MAEQASTCTLPVLKGSSIGDSDANAGKTSVSLFTDYVAPDFRLLTKVKGGCYAFSNVCTIIITLFYTKKKGGSPNVIKLRTEKSAGKHKNLQIFLLQKEKARRKESEDTDFSEIMNYI
ncbi:MAG: hypothetical protein IJM15_02745 [Erysipelotrichaceae bacterium]|nr:hypothetical protein [Erysipelotrichaceae bacterium]